ncbi:MAG: hypothetical protein NTW89_11610 [Burkholderiales bacterium]|nr:hypothetical protein [Burkholderiales bacterium]
MSVSKKKHYVEHNARTHENEVIASRRVVQCIKEMAGSPGKLPEIGLLHFQQ